MAYNTSFRPDGPVTTYFYYEGGERYIPFVNNGFTQSSFNNCDGGGIEAFKSALTNIDFYKYRSISYYTVTRVYPNKGTSSVLGNYFARPTLAELEAEYPTHQIGAGSNAYYHEIELNYTIGYYDALSSDFLCGYACYNGVIVGTEKIFNNTTGALSSSTTTSENGFTYEILENRPGIKIKAQPLDIPGISVTPVTTSETVYAFSGCSDLDGKPVAYFISTMDSPTSDYFVDPTQLVENNETSQVEYKTFEKITEAEADLYNLTTKQKSAGDYTVFVLGPSSCYVYFCVTVNGEAWDGTYLPSTGVGCDCGDECIGFDCCYTCTMPDCYLCCCGCSSYSGMSTYSLQSETIPLLSNYSLTSSSYSSGCDCCINIGNLRVEAMYEGIDPGYIMVTYCHPDTARTLFFCSTNRAVKSFGIDSSIPASGCNETLSTFDFSTEDVYLRNKVYISECNIGVLSGWSLNIKKGQNFPWSMCDGEGSLCTSQFLGSSVNVSNCYSIHPTGGGIRFIEWSASTCYSGSGNLYYNQHYFYKRDIINSCFYSGAGYACYTFFINCTRCAVDVYTSWIDSNYAEGVNTSPSATIIPNALGAVNPKWCARSFTYAIHHPTAINSPVFINEEDNYYNTKAGEDHIHFYEVFECTIGNYTVMCVLLKSKGLAEDYRTPNYFSSHSICGSVDSCSGCSFVKTPTEIVSYGIQAHTIKGVIVESENSNVVNATSLHHGVLPLPLYASNYLNPEDDLNINSMSNYDCRPYGLCCVNISAASCACGVFIDKYNTVGAWDLISIPIVVNSEDDMSYPQIAVYTTSVAEDDSGGDDCTGDDSGGGETPTPTPTEYQGVYFGTKKITNVYFGEKDITKLMFGNLTVIE